MLRSLPFRFTPLRIVMAVCALALSACGDRTAAPADLVFINGAEVGSIDPSQVSAQVDGRVVARGGRQLLVLVLQHNSPAILQIPR